MLRCCASSDIRLCFGTMKAGGILGRPVKSMRWSTYSRKDYGNSMLQESNRTAPWTARSCRDAWLYRLRHMAALLHRSQSCFLLCRMSLAVSCLAGRPMACIRSHYHAWRMHARCGEGRRGQEMWDLQGGILSRTPGIKCLPQSTHGCVQAATIKHHAGLSIRHTKPFIQQLSTDPCRD